MTLAGLRRSALALPEVDETTHFGMVAFSVRGKGFASVSKDGSIVHLQLPDADAAAFLAKHPEGERFVRMGTPIGVSVPLAHLDARALDDLLRQAWQARAPKRLVAEHRRCGS